MKVDNIKPHVDLFGFPVRHGLSIVPVKEIFTSQAGPMDLFDWFRDYDVRFFTSSSNSYVVRLRPLNTQSPLIDVVFLHETGAGAARFIEVLEGNHGLQKRSPPLADTAQ